MNRHLLFDRALHALESDAKLIFQKLAHGTHAPVPEVIDVVGLIDRFLLFINRVLAHLQNIRDDLEEIPGRQKRIFDPVHFRFAHLDIEFQTADPREIVLA